MKKTCIIFAIALALQSCTIVVLRPGIKGTIVDSKTHEAVQDAVIFTGSGMQQVGVSDSLGNFTVRPVTKTRLNLPGEERDRLSPLACMLQIRKANYTAIEVEINGKHSTDGGYIILDTIALRAKE